MPPALGRFSTTIVWPRGLPIACAITRATVSVGPPAAYGTSMVMFLVGYCCANALTQNATAAISVVTNEIRFIWAPVGEAQFYERARWRARRDSNPRPLASEANTLIR